MDLVKMTRDLGTEIQNSTEYKRITAAKIANDADIDLQNLIEQFNMTRTRLSAIMQAEDKDEELLASLDSELKLTYTTVMGNKNMMEFNEAKQDIDKLMNQINTVLVAAVNGEDPQTCDENPPSCSGDGCSSCSGCH